MNLGNINNLVELFFKQVENQKDKKKVLLSSLKDKNVITGKIKNDEKYPVLCFTIIYRPNHHRMG